MHCNWVIAGRLISTALYFLLCGIEYAVILPTLNGYLISMDAPDGFLGIVMASFSFTGLVTAPIYGKVSDKMGSAKLSVIVSNLFEIAGNLLYFFGNNYFVIWTARLVAGIGSGSSSSILGMMSRSTTEKERTAVFSLLMSMRQVGLIFGPGFNIFLERLDLEVWSFPVNQYTSPGLVMAALWVLHTIFMIFLFKDTDETSENSANRHNNDLNAVSHTNDFDRPIGENAGVRSKHISNVSFVKEFLREEIVLLLALTFMTMFTQTGMEAAVTPMTLLFFDWGGLYNSYMYCLAGAALVFGYIILALLSKRFSDRRLLLGGCICLLLTYLLDTAYTSTLVHWDGLEAPGWLLPVFCIGTFLLTLGLPFVWITLASLFSKITSMETQGFNQGVRLVAMGVGQILGPIWAASMATEAWLPIMLGVDVFLMCILTVMMLASYDKLVPRSSAILDSDSGSSQDGADEHEPLLNGRNRELVA